MKYAILKAQHKVEGLRRELSRSLLSGDFHAIEKNQSRLGEAMEELHQTESESRMTLMEAEQVLVTLQNDYTWISNHVNALLEAGDEENAAIWIESRRLCSLALGRYVQIVNDLKARPRTAA